MTILARNHEPETPYVFQEYPKWVTPANGIATIVESLEEEEFVMTPIVEDPPFVEDEKPLVDDKKGKKGKVDESLA